MTEAWRLLVDLGLPDGPPRPPPGGDLDPAAVRAAVLEVARSPSLSDAKASVLVAWLRAWRHHWPASFADALGVDGEELLARLEPRVDDANRYLKLRRIAIANLAHIL